MTGPRPEILLFDLGGVLLDNAMFEELPSLLPEPLDGDELRRRWLFSPAVQAFERGQISAGDFGARFVAEWGLDLRPAQFLEAFAAWPRGPYPGALDLLERLRPHYRLAILSNSNAVHWARVTAFRDRVEAAFASHLMGEVKPALAIFERVADALGSPPAAIAFFDDSRPNIEAARAVGMNAHLTQGIGELEIVLQTLLADP